MRHEVSPFSLSLTSTSLASGNTDKLSHKVSPNSSPQIKIELLSCNLEK